MQTSTNTTVLHEMVYLGTIHVKFTADSALQNLLCGFYTKMHFNNGDLILI